MPEPISPRQRHALALIAAHQRRHDLPPSFPALSVGMAAAGHDCLNPGELEADLAMLTRLGLLRSNPGNYYQRTVTAAGWHALGLLTLGEVEEWARITVNGNDGAPIIRATNELVRAHFAAAAELPDVER